MAHTLTAVLGHDKAEIGYTLGKAMGVVIYRFNMALLLDFFDGLAARPGAMEAEKAAFNSIQNVHFII
jgi:hypothetical protein